MTPTSDDIARIRRMIAEPTTTTYTDQVLREWLARYALVDRNGIEPQYLAQYSPPIYADNTDWIATYDFNAVAADVWAEKASSLASRYDFRDDRGQDFKRSQGYQQALAQSRYYRSRRASGHIQLKPATGRVADSPIINEAE